MKVKFFINPRPSQKFVEDGEYQSQANAQTEIKRFVTVADIEVNMKIVASVKELQNDNNGLEFWSFDSVLKSYPQQVATLLQELIEDLNNRGESESAWFDFHFQMETKNEFVTLVESAVTFDFVAYYNKLQSEKSSMLLNNGGFFAMISVNA